MRSVVLVPSLAAAAAACLLAWHIERRLDRIEDELAVRPPIAVLRLDGLPPAIPPGAEAAFAGWLEEAGRSAAALSAAGWLVLDGRMVRPGRADLDVPLQPLPALSLARDAPAKGVTAAEAAIRADPKLMLRRILGREPTAQEMSTLEGSLARAGQPAAGSASPVPPPEPGRSSPLPPVGP